MAKNFWFRFLIFAFLIIFSTLLLSWSGHESYTYLVVKSLKIDVDRLVEIRPYTYKESRVYNMEFYYTDDFAGQRKFFDSLNDGIFPPDPEPVDGKLPVWQIMTIYAQFPDFGMDEGLNLSPLQSLIGNSQGVRHMRYKLGLIEAFEGDKSFLYFVEMSKQAFSKGDEYWGYRFLSYALHYMEDLFQPYHETPGTFWEVVRSLMDKKTKNLLNNAHYTYDNYLAFLIHYSKHSEEIRNLITSTPKRRIPSNYEALINEVMMYGYSRFPEVHKRIKDVMGDMLTERVPTLEDFKRLEAEGKLDKLYDVTKEIIVVMTGTIKAFLENYLSSYVEK
ncbi:hypothetical protein SAMN04488510_12017 [Fervidobacterium changbaicum]|uniref:Phospholipase n=2 Tax=Fervidobacterium TaxID=2422 RepID=A0AAI8CKE6_FERIS|nr:MULTISPECIES: hypothetical protein [Fervidobacterium]AMW32182.1 hypothetical protein NA23_01910 [Fervidobacterium islandicum]QAV32486.1 hypothetical protein CBS1_01150 [Fervidobacterium changbaicum]SDH58094.1 hypothetical protein SAMN04488510_12017 [Fervidobacterium changbaicum]